MSDLLDVLREAHSATLAAFTMDTDPLRRIEWADIGARIRAQIAAQERTERMIAPPRVPTGEQR